MKINYLVIWQAVGDEELIDSDVDITTYPDGDDTAENRLNKIYKNLRERYGKIAHKGIVVKNICRL